MKIIILLLVNLNIFALNISESAVNGGIKIIDFQTNFATPKAYFYDKQVLVKKIKNNHFRAFVGIPLSAKSGTHTLIIKDFGIRKIDFDIGVGEYKKQYITLKGKKKKYVDLSKKQIDRVIKEKKILQNAKQTWSNQILATDIIYPTKGTITGVFGSQRFFNNKPRRPHSGLDIANKTGTPIKAITSGKVLLADDFYFNGNTVLIDHGQGFLSFYVHLDEILVKQGDDVVVGEKIATMGSTGRSTGPHLHISTYLNQVMVNPELIIGKK